MHSDKLQLFPNAKINLSLEVLFKRDDGFHELNTIFAPVSITDNLAFCFNDSSTIKLNTETDLGEDNIVTKAIRLYQDKYDIELPGLEIDLEKRIPIGAGLGGGSAGFENIRENQRTKM